MSGNIPETSTGAGRTKRSPLSALLEQIQNDSGFLANEQAQVLRLNIAPWRRKDKAGEERGLEHWLDTHFIPDSSYYATFSEVFDPFSGWEANGRNGFKVVRTDADPAGVAKKFWDQTRRHIPYADSLDSFPQPLFDVIDITALLTYPNWRLALDRTLKLLKPGGWVIFPEFYQDALLLDGRVADWVRWNSGANRRRSNRWCRLMYQLLRYIERRFNRPWIPELGLCEYQDDPAERNGSGEQPRPLYNLLLEFCAEDEKSTQFDLSEGRFTLRMDEPLDLFEIPCLSDYISGSELKKLTDFVAVAMIGAGEDQRSIQVGCRWNALQLFAGEKKDRGRQTTCGKIDTVIAQSLTAEHRNFLDASHFLLPEFNPDADNTAPSEEKILRSLRGFVCRMIHHDRFDQDYHHLFVASLWLPERDAQGSEVDWTRGKFAHVTGCVFRREQAEGDTAVGEQALDEALSQITYWAHARWNKMTLQSIPQLFFESDRPVIRVVTGGQWDYHLRGYGQLDLLGRGAGDDSDHESGTKENVEEAVFVPSEITIIVPDFDEKGKKWQEFKRDHVAHILGETEKHHGESRTLREHLLSEMWVIRKDKVFSFPWYTLPDSYGGPEKAARGRPAGRLTELIVEEFKRAGRNILVDRLVEGINPEWAMETGFTKMMNRLLGELGINRSRLEEGNENTFNDIFNALVALTLAFPASTNDDRQTGRWELLQAPIGAFIHSKNRKFVSAGSCLLIKKLLKNPAKTGNEHQRDEHLRQRLCQTRSTQIMRRVPTVLLPLSTLLLANLLSEEERRGKQREERAEAARGLLHNLRNLIAPALSIPQSTREIFDEWFGNPKNRYIDDIDWDNDPFWAGQLSAEGAYLLNSWREMFFEHVTELSKKFGEKVSAEMVRQTLDAYYWYLSADEFPAHRRSLFRDVLVNAITAVWETWGAQSTWEPTDDIHMRPDISDETWKVRKKELRQFREAAIKSPKEDLDKDEGVFWILPNRLGIEWSIKSGERLINYPSIAFHVIYELLWNGIKYLASEIVLHRRAQASVLSVKIMVVEIEGKISITYIQPCSGDSLARIVTALNIQSAIRERKLPEMSGIQGLRSMITRCKWSMNAESKGDELRVEILIA